MLRASATATGTGVDLTAIVDDRAGGGGVSHGGLLTAFAEAALGDDDALLNDTRQQVRDTLGEAALVDAAAVIANYSALDRVADATGIPLEPAKEVGTADLRAELGIDAWRPPSLPGRSG